MVFRIRMPRKGHKSITVRHEVYDKLWDLWEANKEEYLVKGITSFSGFVIKFLLEALKREEQQIQEPRAASP